jgi:hypothetical protein
MRFGKHMEIALVGMLACGACTGVPRTGFLAGPQQRAKVVAPTFDGRTGFDGVKLLAVGNDGVAIWNVLTGDLVTRLRGHTEPVNAAALSPDGHYALTGSGLGGEGWFTSTDNSVRLWDANSGRELHRFGEHSQFIEAVSFSPDGSCILTLSRRRVQVWDVATRQLRAEFPEPNLSTTTEVGMSRNAIVSASISGDHRKLLARGFGWARVWDIDTRLELFTINSDSHVIIWDAELSRDSKFLVLAVGNTAQIRDAGTGALLHVLHHQNFVPQASFSADARQVVTASHDKTARLWDSKTGREVKRFEHPGKVNQALLSHDGTRVLTKWASGLTGEHTDQSSLWASPTGIELQRFRDDGNAPEVIGFSPDGSTFPIFDRFNNTIRLCYSLTGECK